MTVAQLASAILSLEPQRHPSRLAFYHFIKNFLPLDTQFRPEFVDAFYDRAMTISHWKTHRQTLGEVIKSDLVAISKKIEMGLDVKSLHHAHELQWVEIEHSRDFEQLLEKENEVFKKSGEKIKQQYLGNNEILRVRLLPNGRLIAETKPALAVITSNNLELVRPTTRLIYNENLELDPKEIQVLHVSLLKYSCFRSDGSEIKGISVQGHTFAKSEALSGKLHSATEVFRTLKKLESIYINPVTDDYYTEITHQLEKAISVVKTFHPDREMIASEVLKKAISAHKDIFPNDKLLFHLITTLQYHARKKEIGSIDSCQIIQPLKRKTSSDLTNF